MDETRAVGVARTGNTWRVQRQVRGVWYRGSFDTIELANKYSAAVSSARERKEAIPTAEEFNGTRQASVPVSAIPTRLDDLVRYALEERTLDRNTSLATQERDLADWQNSGAVFFKNCLVSDVTRSEYRDFRNYLADDLGYAVSTSRKRLRVLDQALEVALREGAIASHPGKGISAKESQNPRTEPDWNEKQPITFAQVKVFTAQFKPHLRLAIWLCFITCLRISEVFGLELRDWNAGKGTLRVERQGGAKRRDGDGMDRTKTKSGKREIYIPPSLNSYIESHVLSVHGPRPQDPADLAAYLSRRLIVVPRSDDPWQVVLAAPWADARAALGLDFKTIGYRVNRHFLRMSGSTWIGLKIQGPEWSKYLGHAIKFQGGLSETTFTHYFRLPDKQMMVIAEIQEQYIQDEIGVLEVEDAWADLPHRTVAEAALELGVSEGTVRRLLQDGTLWAANGSEVDAWRHLYGHRANLDRVIVCGASIASLRSARLDRQETYCSVKQAATHLGVTIRAVTNMLEDGVLVTDGKDAKGCRIDLVSVDAARELLLAEQREAEDWLAYREVARQLNATYNMIDRWAREGVLAWRYPLGQRVRVYDRASVERMALVRTRGRALPTAG